MHVEDKRPRAPVQGMDREETISGKKGREEGRSEKKGARKPRDKAKPACIIPPEAFRIFIVTTAT